MYLKFYSIFFTEKKNCEGTNNKADVSSADVLRKSYSKTFHKFTGKHLSLCQSVFIKKDFDTSVFCKFYEIFTINYIIEYLRPTVSIVMHGQFRDLLLPSYTQPILN